MKNSLLCLVTVLMTIGYANPEDGGSRSLFDFSEAESRKAWVAVNDGVMGGRSEGGPEFRDGVLRFSGRLSLENNGGFSSVRRDVDLDLSAYSGLRLRVRADGRTYQLRLQTDSRYAGWLIAYSSEFVTRSKEWIEVDVPFEALQAGFRGRSLRGYTFDPARIQSVSLMLADKQEGPFGMEVAWIRAYR